MSLLGFLAVVALCGALGGSLLGIFASAEDPPASRAVLGLVAGMLALHLWLTLLQAVGLRWTPLTLAVASVGAAAAWWLLPRPPRAPPERRLGWPEGLALAAIAAFAFAALRLWIVFPDFVFHWGIKGERFALAGGIDWEFLARPWNWRSHPDYPNLLPELFASTALLGGWRESAMMAWSVLMLGLAILAAREAMARGGVADRPRQLATAALASLVAAFAVGNLMAGSADWLVALSLLVAWPALVGPPTAKADLRIALAGAFAAAAKVEGVPLAALLVGVSLARRLAWRRRLESMAAVRTAALPALVVGLWWLACRRHALFQPFNTGSFDLARWPEVAGALLGVMVSAGSWGAPLLLVALPLFAWLRGLRAPAAVVAGQLGFYVYVYMSAPIDPTFSVQSTFARLAFHLWPAVAVGLVVASERLVRRPDSCDPSAP